jgi:SAM-dependent methyltransferase
MTPQQWALLRGARPDGEPVTPQWVESRWPKERYAWDVHHLELPDDSVDFVDASFLMAHLHDPTAAVREAMRVLRPEGALRFNYWCQDGEFPDYLRLKAALHRKLDRAFPRSKVEIPFTWLANGSPRHPIEEGSVFLLHKTP